MGRQQIVVLCGLGLVGLIHRHRDDKALPHKVIDAFAEGIIRHVRHKRRRLHRNQRLAQEQLAKAVEARLRKHRERLDGKYLEPPHETCFRELGDHVHDFPEKPCNRMSVPRERIPATVLPKLLAAPGVPGQQLIFHIIRRCLDAVEELRLRFKREAQAETRRQERRFKARLNRNAAHRRWYRKTHPKKYKGKRRGPKPKRKNEKFRPETLSNGDTLVELLTRS